MILGYPIAFSLAALGLAYAMLGSGSICFPPGFLQALPDRLFAVLANETLLAIPFFAFMGLVLERSRMAEDLLDTMGQLFGSLRGGLAYAVIVVGALLCRRHGRDRRRRHRHGADLAADHAAATATIRASATG